MVYNALTVNRGKKFQKSFPVLFPFIDNPCIELKLYYIMQSINVACALWETINAFVEHDSSLDETSYFSEELNKSFDALKCPNPFQMKPPNAVSRYAMLCLFDKIVLVYFVIFQEGY